MTETISPAHVARSPRGIYVGYLLAVLFPTVQLLVVNHLMIDHYPDFVDVVQPWLVEHELSISSAIAVQMQDSIGSSLSVNISAKLARLM